MRNREIVTSSELVTTVLHAADFMKGLIDAVETSNEADVSGHIAALQQFRAEAEPTNTHNTAVEAARPVVAAVPEATSTLSEATREFLVECSENLDAMDQDLLTLEQNANSPNVLRGVFRTMHTIKGGAGFLGLGQLERLAHAAENLLGKVRDGKLALTSDAIGILLATVDKCREGVKLVERCGSDAGFDADMIVDALLIIAESESPTAVTTVVAETVTAPATTPTPSEKASAQPTPTPVAAPSPAPAAPTVTAKNEATSTPTEAPAADKSASPTADTTIRVDVGLLDKLMNRVGELVLARNQILQCTQPMDDAELLSTAQRLNLITTELQEGVMKTRMQPIGNVWSKFPRVVRDLASQLRQTGPHRDGRQGNRARQDDHRSDQGPADAPGAQLGRPRHRNARSRVEAAGKPAEGRLLLRASTKAARSTSRSPTTAPA